ncbi:rRNA methyltransferase [Boudabousia liubingyangii]|uniref:rRNA methyltransferase n=1 Tax=Boudabousia liubingyangii TaxID=1921764 RepID=A0A1Q5PJ97_9ACTO|nr:RNA methyltransferase [Boudabousia liubingyangii]OKL45962.1 rRNA methyltransferase [Boudabousia liubingyangii]OKL47762.1 rRNA methyltransferase [Boudabousia liubingyangii]
MIIEIKDLNDTRLEVFTNMTDVRLRKLLEYERGVFMAESFNVIDRALKSGCQPISFLLSERWLETLRDVLSQHFSASEIEQIPFFVASEDVLTELTGFHLHRGAIGAMERPALAPVKDLLSDPQISRVLILENLVDHTNVGACFRSAAALGIDAVLITPSCADPLYRRSVRVSMGGVFQVPWTRLEKWPDLDLLRELGFRSAALALSDNAIDLDTFSDSSVVQSPDSKLALVMGTEGDGLKKSTIAGCDYVVKIPMSGDVDSLNVAAASAVAIWATRKSTSN